MRQIPSADPQHLRAFQFTNLRQRSGKIPCPKQLL
jgi:hypothetical protein